MQYGEGGAGISDPLIGQQLGKNYRVVERLAAGGMGVVYVVEHAALRKQFAAKVLSKELATDDEARARFEAEAHAASRLQHENIVSLTDYGLTTDARPYFVMELLRGQTLDQRLAEGPLALEEIVAVVIPVARALAEAHAEGIVHRDVKPENVFLTQRPAGRWGVKMLDFGIAKLPLGGARLTRTGQALGSPAYMAPEACRGDEIDHRADIYSLGVLMYLLWCGSLPFDDDNLLRVLQLQVSAPVPPPRSRCADMSPELEAVLLCALAKEPDDRFLSIALLLSALEQALPTGADRLLIEAARGTRPMLALSGLFTPRPIRATPSGEARTSDPPAPTRPSLQRPPVVRSESDLAPAAPPVGGRSRTLIGVAVGALMVGLVVAYAATRGGGHAPVAPAITAVAAPAAVTSTPAPGPALAQPTAAAAPTIAVVVRTARPGARVFLDDRPLGTTPLATAVPGGAGVGELRVELAGHEAWTRSVALDAPIDLEATLIAIRRSRTARPRHTRHATSSSSSSSSSSSRGGDADARPPAAATRGPDLGIRTSR